MESIRRTRRWRGIIAVALFTGAVGLLFKRPSVLLLSVVGVAYATYPGLTSAPSVSLDLDRRLGTEEPVDGEPVEVTVSLRNTGSRILPDLRIVDGVPPMLSVAGGAPRHAATLRPGEATSFSYSVRARQGTHRFEPATVIARDVSGASEVETTVAAETSIECTADVPEVPLRQQTRQYVGHLVTNEGGSGVEFHRTREYQRGDELSRIDWRRFARTGELATTEFRQERAASVVLCLDSRAAAYRSAGDDEPHAVAHSLAGVEQLFAALTDTPNTVGIASFGEHDAAWLPPGAGGEHFARARQLLGSHPSFSPYPPEESGGDAEEQITALRRRLTEETQVVLFSPLPDDESVAAAMRIEAEGNAVTVISPDVTADDTVGAKLARTERRNRVHTLREAGIRVVDWNPNQPLGTALMYAQERWSQ